MSGFFWNVILALIWVILSGSFSPWNLFMGFMLGYGVLLLMQHRVPELSAYSRRLPRVILFVGYFLKELFKANLRVAFDVVTPKTYMQPGVIGIPLSATTNAEITMVSSMISLTPGTLSLDVSNDRKVLYIHAMFLQDEAQLRQDLKELERRILMIMR